MQLTLAGLPVSGTAPAPQDLTSASDEFYTPRSIRDCLPLIDLDPCSPSHRPIDAGRHYVGSEGQDGLALDWHGVVFCNPPYSRGSIERWTAKAAAEVEAGRARAVIGLLPSRTDCGYWWRSIWGRARVGFLRSRLRFEDATGAATPTAGTFGSVFVLWGADPGLDELRRKLAEAGLVVPWTT